ncbi:hypothetical protein HPT25_21240 [Bacillus sp. BRMEA1]|uniref:DUF6054 family protein n=1 Tax=Neobacillus endophyticus TaxID=2738405 RepID=UPI0015635D46|nr:DUF6054 family protein [Neobacillus endophyticus]NRD79865.1 hypothetical protein [Neobacillus endophyticus]
MRQYLELTIDVKPFQAVQLILENKEIKSALIFDDYKVTGDDEKEISILVFEKFFFRTGNTASLTVTVDNFGGVTVVKCISSGNGDGILDIDWGVGKSFIKQIRKKLDSHIIEVMKET